MSCNYCLFAHHSKFPFARVSVPVFSLLGPFCSSFSYFPSSDSNWIRYRADLDEPELQETIEAFQVLNLQPTFNV